MTAARREHSPRDGIRPSEAGVRQAIRARNTSFIILAICVAMLSI